MGTPLSAPYGACVDQCAPGAMLQRPAKLTRRIKREMRMSETQSFNICNTRVPDFRTLFRLQTVLVCKLFKA